MPIANCDCQLRTAHSWLHKTSLPKAFGNNPFAIRRLRITRSDRALLICILYFCLCILIRNNKSAITNSKITNSSLKFAHCQLRLPTAHCLLNPVFLLLYFLFYQTLRVWVNFFLKAISHLDIRRDLTRIGAPFSCRRRAGDEGFYKVRAHKHAIQSRDNIVVYFVFLTSYLKT